MQLNEIELWLDMQFSPQIAKWISQTFLIKAISSYDMFSNTTKDEDIYLRAKALKNVILLTKDRDFVEIQARLQPPPKIILLKNSNRSNDKMKIILNEYLLYALEELINTPSELVEINQENIF